MGGPPSDFACPSCGHVAAVAPAGEEQIVTCPSCGREFTVPAADVSDAVAREDELDGVRIAIARRAAYRARSYAIIAAAVCLVAAGQFVWTVRAAPVRHAIFAAASLAGFVYFARLARRLHDETKGSILPNPTTPPDFTGLGDGGEASKKLEDVR
jgi:hypothetical protein